MNNRYKMDDNYHTDNTDYRNNIENGRDYGNTLNYHNNKIKSSNKYGPNNYSEYPSINNNHSIKNYEYENRYKKVYDLSVKDISKNLSSTFIDMVNDYSKLSKKDDNRLTDYVRIITKEERLIYVGIIFIIVSLIVFFISISE